MKINVIGATGMVGTQVVAEAVARGHEVAAYSRSGKAVEGAASSSGLDMADTVRTVEAVNDADVTIIAVSTGRGGQVH